MHNIKNTSDFIELLEIEYPEKALALLGMNFHARILYTYLTVNALDEHSFNPIKFKNYLKNPFINIPNIPYYNSLSVYNTGDIAFHDSTQKLHIFNGNDWIEFTTN